MKHMNTETIGSAPLMSFMFLLSKFSLPPRKIAVAEASFL
jgi:hypothetical protein